MTTDPIPDARLAEMVGARVPCVPANPGEVAALVQELRARRATPAPVVGALESVAEQAYWLLAWMYQSHLFEHGKPFDMSIFAPEARDLMNKGEQDLFDALVTLAHTREAQS